MEKRMNIFDMFLEGARKGWDIAIHSLLPNVIMAFTIIKFFQVTGILKFIGIIFAPVMGIFGLPGEAITVNLTAVMSQAGAIGVLAGLISNGSIDVRQVTIILPSVFAAGGILQNIGRVLGTSGVNTRYYGVLVGVTLLNGILALIIMSILTKIFY